MIHQDSWSEDNLQMWYINELAVRPHSSANAQQVSCTLVDKKVCALSQSHWPGSIESKGAANTKRLRIFVSRLVPSG